MLDKKIKTSLSTANATSQSIDLQTFTFPSTLFGFHYTCTARLVSSTSETGEIIFALMVVKDGQTTPELDTFNGPTKDLLLKGTEEQVLVSDWLHVVHTVTEHVAEDTTEILHIDDRIGQIKTQRRVQAGDRLMLIFRGNAVLGIHFRFMVTY